MGLLKVNKQNVMLSAIGWGSMRMKKFKGFRFNDKTTFFKIITPTFLVLLLVAAQLTPLHALTPARDLTGTWTNAIHETYYEMDPSDPTTRMNDVSVTYSMIITQSGSSISIVLNVNELSSTTDPAYRNEYGIPGVPSVGFNQIGFTGTVSGASFTADEQGSQLTAEHLGGTFTTDIITATLTGNSETTDVNGIIVLRSGSSSTMPPIVTAAPTPTPTPTPALPTSDNLGSISVGQGTTSYAATGAPVAAQGSLATGSEVLTGNDGIIGFDYPDQGGVVYLGANSDAGWVYLEPYTDPTSGNISYVAVPPPTTGSFSFSEGIEPDEVGQVGVQLSVEVGIALGVMVVTGAPITLGGAVVVEGTILLGTGIAYLQEQLSPQAGTYDVRPVVVPQGLVMGEGTQYVVQVSNGSTIVQVISGSVIFVDKYTNSSITVASNQMLTLPSGVQNGFTAQQLQTMVFAFDASSINQWWKQITPTATPTTEPTVIPIVATPVPTKDAASGLINSLTSPIFFAVIILIIIIAAIAAVLATKRRKTQLKQPSVSAQTQPVMNENPKTAPMKEIPPPPSPETVSKQPKLAFCQNCGKKLENPRGFCPFCGTDLSH